MKRSSQSRFISSSDSRASAIELVSKNRHECFHDTAPSPCAAKLMIICGFFAIEQFEQEIEFIGD